jgi:hypothetical protein
MILMKAKMCPCKMYLPNKPIKHGVKAFVLACGDTSYVYGFDFYKGKTEPKRCFTVDLIERLHGGWDGLQQTHRIVYMDNYYSSILAFKQLAELGLHAVGTVKKTGGGEAKNELRLVNYAQSFFSNLSSYHVK